MFTYSTTATKQFNTFMWALSTAKVCTLIFWLYLFGAVRPGRHILWKIHVFETPANWFLLRWPGAYAPKYSVPIQVRSLRGHQRSVRRSCWGRHRSELSLIDRRGEGKTSWSRRYGGNGSVVCLFPFVGATSRLKISFHIYFLFVCLFVSLLVTS